MSTKTLLYFGGFVGSTIGGMIPLLWGAGFLSYSSILLSGMFGILGVLVTLKLINN